MKIINIEKAKHSVEQLLRGDITGEYPWLDFKQELKLSDSKIDLLHDILCLSNVLYDGDRYLIYGVVDKTWELKGLSEEQELKSSDIHDFIRSQVWNRMPLIAVDHVCIEGRKFGFIVVADTPTKPHYLRKAYRKTIPAGAIYTRHGDTNTPYKCDRAPKCVEDHELELMFRERFGLGKSLQERLELLLSQTKKWGEFQDQEISGYFHEDFPEYQIRVSFNDVPSNQSYEPWLAPPRNETNPNQKEGGFSPVNQAGGLFRWGSEFRIYYHSTLIQPVEELIWLYKIYCPYPSAAVANGRYLVKTRVSQYLGHRIRYYVGAIVFSREANRWKSEIDLCEGETLFDLYNHAMRQAIRDTMADRGKEPILLLDVDLPKVG